MNPLVDLKRLAESGQPLEGQWALSRFERLMAGFEEVFPNPESCPMVTWRAKAEWRPSPVADSVVSDPPLLWLHLSAQAPVPLVCQRCLEPFRETVSVDRWFRFVRDETTAAAEDEDSEEDVLVLTPRLDLLELLEDELLLGLPLVPMHTRCPQPLPVASADAQDQRVAPPPQPHPFAGLAALKKPPLG